MDRGAKALAYMLLSALALGLVVVLLQPDYRAAALSFMRGEPETNPLWLSNHNYYDDVQLERDAGPGDAE